MKRKIEFETSKPLSVLKNETHDYFQKHGFKVNNEKENFLQFSRGSILQNMFTFNPLKWKSLITIQFGTEVIVADFDITTTYQAVTLKEERMWEIFISNYQKTIETGHSLIDENKAELKATKKSSWNYIGYAVLGAIVFGIPSAVITYFIGIDSVVTIGAISGSLAFMLRKIEKEKEENAT